MELKKNPKYDLDQKKGMFRNLGLTISLLVTIIVFEIPPSGTTKIIDLGQLKNEVVEIMNIPPTTQPPPRPPEISKIPDIIEVPNESEIEEELDIDLDVEVIEITAVEEIVFDPIDISEEVADYVFVIVEEQPEFPGGMQAFYEFIGSHIKYPAVAKRNNIEGRVFVEFIVEKNGELSDIVVVKGIGASCDEEAMRVLKLVPNFKPGKQRGVPVRVKMVLPIYFKLVQI